MINGNCELNPTLLWFNLLYWLYTQTLKKCFAIFGKVVIKNTRWLFEDALIPKNARTVKRVGLHEVDRTRDVLEDRSLVDRVTGDDINYERTYAYD